MLLTQYTFYRKYGVRVLPQVAMPMMHDLKLLEFPRESVYHYLTFDTLTDGPANDDPLLRHVKKVIPVIAPLQLSELDGHPRRMGGDGTSLVRDYLKTHRRMRRALNPDQAFKDRDTPVVVNYAFVARLYRYLATPFASYYRWRNQFATFIDEFAALSQDHNWQHYVFVHVPKTLPSVRQLQDASIHFNQQTLRVFREPSGFMLLELWKWFTSKADEPSEHPSIFARIPKNKIHLLNFVFVEGGKWCVINFGILNSFYLPEGATEPDTAYAIQARQHVTGLQMAKRILRMYMSIMEARSASIKQLMNQERQSTFEQDEQTAEASEQEALDNPPQVITPDDLQAKDPNAAPPNAQDETKNQRLSDELLSYLNDVSIIDEEELASLSKQDYHRLIREQDLEIDQDLRQLEKLSAKLASEPIHETLDQIVNNEAPAAPEQGVMEVCERMAVNGSLSAAEYRKYQKAAQSYKEIKAPFGQGTLEQFIKIEPQALKIEESQQMPDASTVVDKTMLKSSLALFDSKYVAQVLHKDIANTVMSVQKAGVAVTGYRVDKVEDILGGYEEHVVRLQPVVGQPSTLRFKVPVIKEDGTYVTNGVKYRLRKQRGDLPIRKTAPNIVALTSYYGKCFITRGRRNSGNYGYWLQTAALAKALDKEDSQLTDPICDNVFDPDVEAPRAYTAISNTLSALTVGGRYRIRFDLKRAIKEENITSWPKSAPIYLGKDLTTDDKLWLDMLGQVVLIPADGQVVQMGTLEQFLGIGIARAPVEYTTARFYGKDIPVGVILGLEMGMERMLGALRVEPRIIKAGEKSAVGDEEWGISFADETWVFQRKDKLASMILGGFNEYDKSLKLFSAHSFDQRGAYVNLLETNGIGVRYVRELDLMTAMFVDSITRDILIEMDEPTTFKGLLFRANQMLLADNHPDELDPAQMRIKGYERVSGAIYTELIGALRQHNSSLGRGSLGVQMNPYSVWKRISEDPAKLQVSEINPLATLKDAEAVTYLGEGGRGRLSMTKGTRGYHPNDMGTISEATVDNSDVSINIHTSADPQFTSLRGMSKRFDFDKPNPTALLSTSALLAPASDRDDPKRVNFVSIQQKHAIACDGYHQPIVRTGYETVLAHRTSDLYAFTAKKAGVVRSLVDKGIIVDYTDGSAEGYELGRRFGNAQGLTVAHELVSPLKAGDKVAVGDVIVYNTGFFEPDFFNPKQVVWKNSLNVRTVLWESTQTHEDSSSISKRVSEKLNSKVTKVKIIVIAFDQAISHLVGQGDKVVSDSVLCVIQDSVSANAKLFNEQSIETLKALSAQTPRAHVKGVVEKVEVFYHGDKQDMSESVRELADWGDSQLRKLASAVGTKANTGAVDGGFRIENNPLGLDNIAIKIYITSDAGAGVGDKGVFGNQLKTVFGEVLEAPMTSEDGKEIDAIFGYRSLEARIVESPIIIGTTASLLKRIGFDAAAIYHGTFNDKT